VHTYVFGFMYTFSLKNALSLIYVYVHTLEYAQHEWYYLR